MPSQVHLILILSPLWVHSEIVRVFIVAEGAAFVPLKHMRFCSELRVGFLALVGVVSNEL